MKYTKIVLIVFFCLALSGCTTKPDTNLSSINSTARKATIPAGNFYFYSSTCLHCKTVNNYVADNKIRENGIHFFELEINADPKNAEMLRSIGELCKINENDLAVPLLWYNQTCYTGSDQIINYFESL